MVPVLFATGTKLIRVPRIKSMNIKHIYIKEERFINFRLQFFISITNYLKNKF